MNTKDATSPLGSSTSTATFKTSSDLYSSKRYPASSPGELLDGEASVRNKMKAVAQSFGHSIYENGGVRELITVTKSGGGDDKDRRSSSVLTSASASQQKSVTMPGTFFVSPETDEENGSFTSRSHRFLDVGGAVSPVVSSGSPVSIPPSASCPPNTRAPLGPELCAQYKKNRGPEKGILKKTTLYPEGVGDGDRLLAVNTVSIAPSGAFGTSPATGGGGMLLSSSVHSPILPNIPSREEQAAVVGKPKASMRPYRNGGDALRGRWTPAPPPMGPSAPTLLSSQNARTPRVDNSEETKLAVSGLFSSDKVLGDEEDSGEHWLHVCMTVGMKCVDLLMSIWSTKILPFYSALLQHTLWTVCFVFCVVFLMVAAIIMQKTISFLNYAKEGQKHKNSQAIHVSSQLTRRMFELQKARDAFGDLLQEALPHQLERESGINATPATTPKKKSFFFFSSTSSSSSSTPSSSSASPITPTASRFDEGEIDDDTWWNYLVQKDLYQEIQNELQQVDAARQQSLSYLHRVSGYQGPIEDVQFLVNQHVKYGLLVKELAEMELSWVGLMRDDAHLRIHRLPVRENYAVISPENEVSRGDRWGNQDPTSSAWKKGIMVVPSPWPRHTSHAESDNTRSGPSLWSGFSHHLLSKIPLGPFKNIPQRENTLEHHREHDPQKEGRRREASIKPTGPTEHHHMHHSNGGPKRHGEKVEANAKHFFTIPLQTPQEEAGSPTTEMSEEDTPEVPSSSSSCAIPRGMSTATAPIIRSHDAREDAFIQRAHYPPLHASHKRQARSSASHWAPHTLAYNESVTVITKTSPASTWWWRWWNGHAAQEHEQGSKNGMNGKFSWMQREAAGYSPSLHTGDGRRWFNWGTWILFCFLGLLFVFL